MPKRVLVVDDDPAQRRILEETIKRFGYAVAQAESGDKAIAALKADALGDISLILLDLVMRGTDGMAVLSAMRPLPRKYPTIVQTAGGSIDAAIAAMRAGAVDFVVKPVSPERLEVSIKNALKIDALEGEISRIEDLRPRRAWLCRSGRRERNDGEGRRSRAARGEIRQFRC